MHIKIYPEKCIAVGRCVSAAPDLFEQNDDDGMVALLRADVPAGREQAALSAARLCPTLAIVVEED